MSLSVTSVLFREAVLEQRQSVAELRALLVGDQGRADRRKGCALTAMPRGGSVGGLGGAVLSRLGGHGSPRRNQRIAVHTQAIRTLYHLTI